MLHKVENLQSNTAPYSQGKDRGFPFNSDAKLFTCALHGIVRDELKDFFSQPLTINLHLEEAERNLAEKTRLLEVHQKEIQKIREEMAKTHRLYLADQISVEGFGQIVKPAEERLSQLQTELPKLEAEVDFPRVNKLSTDDVIHESTDIYQRWPSFAPEDKRKIVETLIESLLSGTAKST